MVLLDAGRLAPTRQRLRLHHPQPPRRTLRTSHTRPAMNAVKGRTPSVGDERPHVAPKSRDLIAVFLGRTAAEVQVKHRAAERVRVAQRFGDLGGRTVELPFAGL